VLLPNLLSLADGLGQFTTDIARMERAGMLSVHRFLQFIQCVIL
jgi:hypothetical protein